MVRSLVSNAQPCPVNHFGYTRAQHNSPNHKSQFFLFFFTVSDIFHKSSFREVLEKMKSNEPGSQTISRLEALAAGKACYARLYSYARLKQREPFDSHRLLPGGVLTFVCAVPH